MAQPAVADGGAVPDKRARLRDLIAELSYESGRSFTLASGKTSGHFFNMKQSMLHPEASTLMAEMILEVMAREGLRSIGGLEIIVRLNMDGEHQIAELRRVCSS